MGDEGLRLWGVGRCYKGCVRSDTACMRLHTEDLGRGRM